jgi:hypothetical protein
MWTSTTVSLFVIIGCFTLAISGFSTVYDDTYARNLFRVNGAAYSNNSAACIKNIASLGSDWRVVKRLELPSSPLPALDATVAFIILKSDVQKQYIVSFRGTVGEGQLIAQLLQFAKIPFEDYGLVNTYFQNSFKLLWPSIRTELSNAKTDGYSVVVTGFSLGGALAAITGLKIVAEGHQTNDQVYLLTYGEPRVGNSRFAEHIDGLFKYSHRVVNKADLVPHIPPCLSLSANSCTRFLGVGYYHHQTEIWYPDGSAAANSVYVTTKTNEDPRGSNILGDNRQVADHLTYFGVDPEQYAGNNCIG